MHQKTAAVSISTVEVKPHFFTIYHICCSVINCTESAANCAAVALQFIVLLFSCGAESCDVVICGVVTGWGRGREMERVTERY